MKKKGIYDMIDIFGDDPAIGPTVLCHGHKVYRGVDLGVRFVISFFVKINLKKNR